MEDEDFDSADAVTINGKDPLIPIHKMEDEDYNSADAFDFFEQSLFEQNEFITDFQHMSSTERELFIVPPTQK